MSYRLTPHARGQLAEIYAFTLERWGRAKAEAYTRQIADCCAALPEQKALLRQIPGRPGRFLRKVGAHLLVVRPVAEGFEILAILHKSMDLGARIGEIPDDDA